MTTRYEFMARVVELTVEYADEAEHQDGEEYWDNFESSDQAAVDFGRYLVASDYYRGDLFKVR